MDPAGLDHHRVLLYRSAAELRVTVVPFLRDGLDLGEAVIAALCQEEEDAIVEVLGPRAEELILVAADAYPSPEQAVEAMRALFAAQLAAGAGRVRIAGSLPRGFGESWELWARYETEIDAVLRELPVTAMCVYDAAQVSDRIARHVLELHPAVAEPFGMSRANPDYAPV